MLLNKATLGLAKLASKESSRYATGGIAIEKDCAIVTDGHIMVHLENPSGGQADEYFPVTEGNVIRVMDGTQVLVSADAALAALKTIPRKAPSPVLQTALLAEGDRLIPQ